jgi:hypothetical protein
VQSRSERQLGSAAARARACRAASAGQGSKAASWPLLARDGESAAWAPPRALGLGDRAEQPATSTRNARLERRTV